MSLSRENLRDSVNAWIREDLTWGAKMSIGFYAPKLIERLEAILSKLGREEDCSSQSQPLTDAGTPAPRSHDQPLSDGWRPRERFKAWCGGMDTEGENAGEFTAQVVFASHADCVSFLRFFAAFDPPDTALSGLQPPQVEEKE